MKKLTMWSMLVLVLFVLAGCGKCEHEYDSGVITKESTCAENGEKIFTCSLCGETKTESVMKKSHVYQEEITKEPTFDEEGEMTFTCDNCGDSYKESIPVRDDEVVITVTNKSNLPENTSEGRYSDRVELTFDVMNRTDKIVKGVQGELTVFDLFDEEILVMNCDFTGNSIPVNDTITIEGLGMDVNPFIDSNVKFYNTDFSDLKFQYTVTNIVYEDGTNTMEAGSTESIEEQKVIVNMTNKQNLEIDYNAGRYMPQIQFTAEVFNKTSKNIKGVQGVLTVKDLFGVDIMSSQLDFTGKIIVPNESTVFDLVMDVNEFLDDEVKVYNTDFSDLNFEYEVTSIVYEDGTTE